MFVVLKNEFGIAKRQLPQPRFQLHEARHPHPEGIGSVMQRRARQLPPARRVPARRHRLHQRGVAPNQIIVAVDRAGSADGTHAQSHRHRVAGSVHAIIFPINPVPRGSDFLTGRERHRLPLVRQFNGLPTVCRWMGSRGRLSSIERPLRMRIHRKLRQHNLWHACRTGDCLRLNGCLRLRLCLCLCSGHQRKNQGEPQRAHPRNQPNRPPTPSALPLPARQEVQPDQAVHTIHPRALASCTAVTREDTASLR